MPSRPPAKIGREGKPNGNYRKDLPLSAPKATRARSKTTKVAPVQDIVLYSSPVVRPTQPVALRIKSTHRYAVGEHVQMLSGGLHSNRPAGPCVVVRLLPFEGSELQYRVQSQGENCERIVSETNLVALAEV